MFHTRPIDQPIRLVRRIAVATLLALVLAFVAVHAQPAAGRASAPPPSPEWVQRSNANAAVLMQVMARFGPEQAGFLGLSGYDEEIFDLKSGVNARVKAATEQAITALEVQRAAEKDPAVLQDLDILLESAKEQIEGQDINERLVVPYFDLHGTVFQGLRALLDDQVEPKRRAAALVRLRRYAGLENGYEPIAKLAEERIREKLADPALIGPIRAEVENDLANQAAMMDGIAQLFGKYSIKGWQEPLKTLRRQLDGYSAFITADVLPRARTDFRQPPELYAFGLRQVGVDMPVADLASRAKVAFREIQNEMQALAPLLAKEQGFASGDYRLVIGELKKRQFAGGAILPHYEARIRDLEKLIVEHHIVTLPDRPMQIRLASEAESAQQPAPNMRPPRLIGNTGEKGTFVLPLHKPGSGMYDDFTFEAGSWTLTAHEGRPGHELQFASIVEKGVSIPRALFAFNSVNVEGWGLYAEAEMKPYEPLDGQIIALQHRLLRAARAFLDPGLQQGTITKDEALRVLQDDVVLSLPMATQEVERYTFRAPGQATSYFCGYQRLMELRTDTERMLGRRFDRQKYHDFVLAQGLLPPSLLRRAVMEQFVPEQMKSAGN